MKKILYSLFTIAGLYLNAQEFKNYDWGKAETYTPTPAEKDLGEITIFDKKIKEFIVEKEQSYDFLVNHTKTFVNSDEAIEQNNKIYVPLKSVNDNIVKHKVRVIKPNGTVIEMSEADIMESVDEKTNTKLRYFALKGLEKKAVVEQVMIAKLAPKLQGTNIVMQSSDLSKNNSYTIIYPKHLVFKFKSYNGLPEFKIDNEKYTDKVVASIDVDEIPALHEEEYSNYYQHAKRFSYKLAENNYTGKKNLFSYKDYTESVFSIIEEKLDSKTEKALSKFIANIPSGKNDEEKIKAVENYVKKNIDYDEDAQEISVETTLQNKFTNAVGMVKLYYQILDKLKINNQIVMVSDRFKNQIDPKFELYANLDSFAIYFPDTKGYIAPTEIESRFPYLPYKWTNSNAAFLKKTEFGGAVISDYDIKKIKTPGVDYTFDIMDIKVDFSQNPTSPKIINTITFNGYTATSIQPYYDYIPAENIPMFEKDLAENYSRVKENIKITTENIGAENINKPYVLKTEYEGRSLVEKVGDKILFKVGHIIGRQTELYQKEKCRWKLITLMITKEPLALHFQRDIL